MQKVSVPTSANDLCEYFAAACTAAQIQRTVKRLRLVCTQHQTFICQNNNNVAPLDSKGYDNCSNYLLFLGFDGHFNEQKRKFWAFFAKTYPAQATLAQRVVHYLATTRFGAWFIQKYLGMKSRIAA